MRLQSGEATLALGRMKGTTMEFESARDLKEEALARFVSLPGGRSTGVGGRLRASGQRLTAAAVRAGDLLPGSLGLQALLPGPSLGLGVAFSETDGWKLAVRYPWLDQRRAPHLDELMDMAGGEVDVEWTGRVKATSAGSYARLRERCRPLMIGSSVAHDAGTAGTVCAFVQRGDGAPELLSCNHVLADCDRVQSNAAILQPGPSDGGQTADSVGRLAYAYPFEQHAVNVVDCAVATLDSATPADHSTLDGFGVLAGLAPPDWYGPNAEGQSVAKIGRTTGCTRGRVAAQSLSREIEFSVGLRWFADLIEIKGDQELFGALGDSGSMVFTTADWLGVGMIIAVAENGKSYMTRLDTVLSRLGARLAT
jgi:hypothetical protein